MNLFPIEQLPDDLLFKIECLNKCNETMSTLNSALKSAINRIFSQYHDILGQDENISLFMPEDPSKSSRALVLRTVSDISRLGRAMNIQDTNTLSLRPNVLKSIVEGTKLLLQQNATAPFLQEKIIQVCRSGDIASIRSFLTIYSQMFTEYLFATPLDWELCLKAAAENGHEEKVMRALLEARGMFSWELRNVVGVFAAGCGYIPIVHELYGDSRDRGVVNAEVALYEASKNGHLAVVEFLFRHYKFPKEWIAPRALQVAVEHGHLEIVKHLLTIKDLPIQNINTAIKLAMNHKNKNILKALFNYKRLVLYTPST